MKTKLKLAAPALALMMAGMAFAASHFTLTGTVDLSGKKLKAGDYDVAVKKDQAVFTNPDGKTFSLPVKVDQAQTKFSDTMAVTKDVNGSPELTEIDLGGSTTRLVFGQ
jgi:uncharacterized protein (DUF2141 family)